MRTNALKGKIVEAWMTVGTFCDRANFSRSTFDRKLHGEREFNRDEIERIISVLGLTAEETRQIFFCDSGCGKA